MYKSFRVKNYRCFKDLTVGPLERVNLIAGKNNVGKTALLEAIWLFQEYLTPPVEILVPLFRGLDSLGPRDLMASLFINFEDTETIEMLVGHPDDRSARLRLTVSRAREAFDIAPFRITVSEPAERAEDSSNRKHSVGNDPSHPQQDLRTPTGAFPPEVILQHEYQSPDGLATGGLMGVSSEGLRRAFSIGAGQTRVPFLVGNREINPLDLAEKWSERAELGDDKKVIETLRIIQPDLRGLRVLYKKRKPIIEVDLGVERLMPLALSGDGMRSLLLFAVLLLQAKGGVFLVDEIENGLHHSVMKDVWKALAASARSFDVQIFATTHSHECIRAAHEAFCESPEYDFRMHRLDRIDDTIQSVTYDKETLGYSLEAGWEVR
ncbi:MAG: AAA family ATPase [Desulfomonile tiedjei]|nr:AAA family ATPase [Desulfomonile tiedjei]